VSRRRVTAITAVIVFPVLVLAIVLASLLDNGSSEKQPARATPPADRPAARGDSNGARPSPSTPAQTGGAKPPASPLAVLDGGAPPKELSQKLGPASSDGTIELPELRGGPIVLNIWSSDCTPCRGETRVLQSEWERLGSRGVLFLGLNVLDSPGSARRFRADYGITYPSVEEKRSDTARQLGARGVPETFFISKSGKIVSHVVGAVSLPQIELGIKAAQTGRSLPTDQGGGQIPLR
jgi:cytochrome c biogenesis protein CcmG, thiol:disulfide interchange protein DsbE